MLKFQVKGIACLCKDKSDLKNSWNTLTVEICGLRPLWPVWEITE